MWAEVKYRALSLVFHVGVPVFVLISGYFQIRFNWKSLCRFVGMVLFYVLLLFGLNWYLGEPHKVCFDHYDIDWNRTDAIKDEFHKERRMLEKPANYSRMLEIAAGLSEDFDYVRVDLYDCAGKVLFGKLTFTPFSCIMTHYKQYWMSWAIL